VLEVVSTVPRAVRYAGSGSSERDVHGCMVLREWARRICGTYRAGKAGGDAGGGRAVGVDISEHGARGVHGCGCGASRSQYKRTTGVSVSRALLFFVVAGVRSDPAALPSWHERQR
jgi:hypothetical protein